MSEHTPGPWKINYRRVSPVNGRQDGLDDICHVYGNEDRERANASLIAAAPELLEACAAAIEQIEALDTVLNQSAHEVIGWHLNGEAEPIASFFEDNDIGAIAKLRAAIAKAKGESK